MAERRRRPRAGDDFWLWLGRFWRGWLVVVAGGGLLGAVASAEQADEAMTLACVGVAGSAALLCLASALLASARG
ncbi:hypothetical protein ETD86_40925 [Nonomuraea turkmeniaca]|uniref:Uncharacterized protein n=1 Tax=Nonomuraea turkmeniaca TaxID=103838 RepID=A0A5S4F1X7_9ACTN|nr:hypothetical protein [Nonomuraea turkmeniaca]TMR10091.1 hypothetical protein ETD86_40925 [Nonomuraea turkmeniaca]